MATIKVGGLRELGEAMRLLGADVANKAARAATGAAAKLVKDAAKANVTRSPSVDTGDLREAIISKRLPKGQSALTSEHIVTVRGRGKPTTKSGKKRALAPHAHFVEFGVPGHMPAEPFLRPALDQNIRPAIEAMKGRLKQRIDRAHKAGK